MSDNLSKLAVEWGYIKAFIGLPRHLQDQVHSVADRGFPDRSPFEAMQDHGSHVLLDAGPGLLAIGIGKCDEDLLLRHIGTPDSCDRFAKGFTGDSRRRFPYSALPIGKPDRETDIQSVLETHPGGQLEWLAGLARFFRDQVAVDVEVALNLVDDNHHDALQRIDGLAERIDDLERSQVKLAPLVGSYEELAQRVASIEGTLKKQATSHASLEGSLREMDYQLTIVKNDLQEIKRCAEARAGDDVALSDLLKGLLDTVRHLSDRADKLTAAVAEVRNQSSSLSDQLDSTQSAQRALGTRFEASELQQQRECERLAHDQSVGLEQLKSEQVQQASAIQTLQSDAGVLKTKLGDASRRIGWLADQIQRVENTVEADRADQTVSGRTPTAWMIRNWSAAKQLASAALGRRRPR